MYKTPQVIETDQMCAKTVGSGCSRVIPIGIQYIYIIYIFLAVERTHVIFLIVFFFFKGLFDRRYNPLLITSVSSKTILKLTKNKKC